MLTAEQIAAAHKANMETLFGLTNKAFESVEKLIDLNVSAAKAALTDAAETTQAAMSVKDAQELLALQASLFQPLAEKTAAYSRHLYEITANSTAELGKVMEAQAQEAQRKMDALQEQQTLLLAQLRKDIAALPAPDPRKPAQNAQEAAEQAVQEVLHREGDAKPHGEVVDQIHGLLLKPK